MAAANFGDDLILILVLGAHLDEGGFCDPAAATYVEAAWARFLANTAQRENFQWRRRRWTFQP